MSVQKKIGVVVAAASLAMLTACGGGKADGAITMWTPLTGDDGAFMEKLVTDFNAAEEICEVDFQPIPAADLYPKIYSVANSGEDLPELLLMHGPRVAEFARAGL